MQGQIAQLLRMMTGIQEPPNIDLYNRPQVANPDGSTSTIRSLGVNMGGRETLIPTVRHGLDRIMTDEEAIDHFRRTGQHLGRFRDVPGSNAFADFLHRQQEAMGAPGPQSIMVPNDFGAGGLIPMSPYREPPMQMRPPMQQGPAPPVGGREIAAFLGGQANGRSITAR